MQVLDQLFQYHVATPEGRVVAAVTSPEAARAAHRLLSRPGDGPWMFVCAPLVPRPPAVVHVSAGYFEGRDGV